MPRHLEQLATPFILGFFKLRRGSDDIISWLTKYNLHFDRLKGSWDDFRDLDLEYTEDDQQVCTMPVDQQAKVREHIMSLPVNQRPMLRAGEDGRREAQVNMAEAVPMHEGLSVRRIIYNRQRVRDAIGMLSPWYVQPRLSS